MLLSGLRTNAALRTISRYKKMAQPSCMEELRVTPTCTYEFGNVKKLQELQILECLTNGIVHVSSFCRTCRTYPWQLLLCLRQPLRNRNYNFSTCPLTLSALQSSTHCTGEHSADQLCCAKGALCSLQHQNPSFLSAHRINFYDMGSACRSASCKY